MLAPAKASPGVTAPFRASTTSMPSPCVTAPRPPALAKLSAVTPLTLAPFSTTLSDGEVSSPKNVFSPICPPAEA